MVNNIKNDFVSVEYGDWVTLHSFTTNDIFEIIVGDKFAPDIESQILGKHVKDCIETGDGKYQIQFIKKGSTSITSNELLLTNTNPSTHTSNFVPVELSHNYRMQLQKNCISCPGIPTRIPPSTIIVALLSVKKIGPIGYITIVADEHDQCTNDGIYWVGRRISASILAAIKMHPSRHFRYNAVKYWVAQYIEYNNAEKYLSIITRFCNPEEPQTVYVFEQKSASQFKNREYEAVTAMIPCANTSFLVPTTVYYEATTRRYFLNEALYILLREKYGLPYLKLKMQYSEKPQKGYLSLKQHSELNLLGYSVSVKNGLTLEERRVLLSRIIDSGVLSKVEIMNHLEWLINSRTNIINHENAISEWKSDLLYLSNYRLEAQRKIWIDTFKAKHSINK